MYAASTPKLVFLVANTSWYLYNFRLPLLKELLKRGHRVFAFSPHDRYADLLEKFGIPHIDVQIKRSGINPMEDLSLLSQFTQIYKRYKPDIVQHFTIKPVIYGSIAARRAGIEYVFNMIPGMGYIFTETSLKKMVVQKVTRIMYNQSMKFSNHVFFQNREDYDYFMKYRLISQEKSSIVAGTGVDIEKFMPLLHKKPGKQITFIFSGRMLWDKGIGEFVTAARDLKAKYKNTNFLMVGPVDIQNPRGISRNQLDEWNHEGIVVYLGMTDDIKSFLQKADVIVLPSYYREGIPLSLLEGAAMGMPIITTDSTGCREVVDNGANGFLIPVRDARALAAAMERFIQDPNLVVAMGAKSRSMAVTKFDSQNVVQEILQYYPI